MCVDWPLGLACLPLEEVLKAMLDKQESTTVMGKQGGIGMVNIVGYTHKLKGKPQVLFIGLWTDK